MNTLLAGRVALVTGKINLDIYYSGFEQHICISWMTSEYVDSFQSTIPVG